MALDPIIVNIQPPKSPILSKIPKLPSFGPKQTKILTAVAAIVIVLSMVLIVAATALTNNKEFKKSHNIVTSVDTAIEATESQKNDSALPGGSAVFGKGGTSGTNSPVVTLKADPGSVNQGEKAKLTWTTTNNPTSCTASDDWAGPKSTNGSEFSPELSVVQTYLFTITCKTATGTGYSTVPVNVIVQGTSTTVGSPTVNMAAVPAAITTGKTTVIQWESTNGATSCTASGDWSGVKPPSGQVTVGPFTTAKKYSYKLTCKNSAGSSNPAEAPVVVTEPIAGASYVTIRSNPVGPVVPGSTIVLTWSSENNPTSCTASGDWSGNQSTSGSKSIGPLSQIRLYHFQLDCTNSSGTQNESADIQVSPNPPVVAFSSNPSSGVLGMTSNLTWSADSNISDAPTACVASGDWSGTTLTPLTGKTIAVGPLNIAKTYTYGVECTNAGGSSGIKTASVTVSLPPKPVVTLNASPVSFNSGGSATLSWTATNNPGTCTASGDWSGNKTPVSSGNQSTGVLNTVRLYTYTLTCSNAGGSGSATTTVNVTSGTAPVVAPTVTLSLSPTTIGTGNTSTLTWSTTNNPTTCTASGTGGWSGAKSVGGTASTPTMGSAGSYTFILTCSNSAGSSSSTATLTVVAPPTVSLSVNPTTIASGATTAISWSSSGATGTCTAGGGWSGSKALSGGPVTSAAQTNGGSTNITVSFTLDCSNAGGTTRGTANLTVTPVVVVLCSGRTPCYTTSQVAAHGLSGNCWGWNLDRVINITNFDPGYHKGKSGIGTIQVSGVCGTNLASALANGVTAGGQKRNHNPNSKDNTNSVYAPYFVGYYSGTP